MINIKLKVYILVYISLSLCVSFSEVITIIKSMTIFVSLLSHYYLFPSVKEHK